MPAQFLQPSTSALIERQIAHLADAIAGFEMLQCVIENYAMEPEYAVLAATNRHTLEQLIAHCQTLEDERSRALINAPCDDERFSHEFTRGHRELVFAS